MLVEGPLQVEHLDGENWMLLAPLQVTNPRFVVPEGFQTDLTSIPRLFRTFIPKGRNEGKGAVVHDYIYRGNISGMNRAEADQLLLDIMKECGVNYCRRYAIYWGVRSGGMFSWKGK